ncbi:MAG TPA: hypothetical protein VIG24_06255 [Acidimicrobiia bacterium]|jgi:hypothetical protein
MLLESDRLDRLRCLVEECPEEPREFWYLKTDAGMIERNFCYAHALDKRPEDKAAFGVNYIPGSDEGEA